MAPSLDSLPTELIERIIHYLPHRDSILGLRTTCRDLAGKSHWSFGKAYFQYMHRELGPANATALQRISQNSAWSRLVTSLELKGPKRSSKYDNFLVAKGLDGVKLGAAISRFPELETLHLKEFGFLESPAFFYHFTRNLNLRKLKQLDFENIIMRGKDVALLLERHKKTLCYICFIDLNLVEMPDPIGHPRFDSHDCEAVWTCVLRAMQKIKHDCSVEIDNPKQGGKKAYMDPPYEWDESEEAYIYKGLTIQWFEEEEGSAVSDWMNDMKLIYTVRQDAEWHDAVKRLEMFYTHRIWNEGEGGPPPCSSSYDSDSGTNFESRSESDHDDDDGDEDEGDEPIATSTSTSTSTSEDDFEDGCKVVHHYYQPCYCY